ncbi:MAG: efflux RND transporter periplasmic adaptor subunit [Pseudomonadota bacterium]|nr:efflux RND transporter periplasmic adaptor subunit [Pseudomonadota bacterium]
MNDPQTAGASKVSTWLVGKPGAILLAVVLAVLATLVAWRLTRAVSVNELANRNPIPSVSVTQVRVSDLPTTVSLVGTIAARYDMPIGVEGDAGRVAAIYVEAGDHVKRGQVLARLDVSVLQPQVANLEAALEQAKAEADLADAQYRRAQAVGASGALSAEETERRRSTGVTAAAKVRVAAAQLAEAQARLARAELRAPSDGIILARNVEVGQTTTPGGEALFRLSEGGEVELRGQVAEQDIALLKVGQKVAVRLTGVAQIYEGHVRLLPAVIDPQTRLGVARVALTADPNLRPGSFARAEVTVSNAERTVLPQTAVLTDEQGSYVLVVNAQNRVERRVVRVSGIIQGGVTIAEGVSLKDQVVSRAGAFLQEGELVKPILQDPTP